MKRHLIITSILLSIVILSGCGKDEKSAISTLQSEVKEIQKIEQRSENIGSQEDAFNVLRDLNQSMKQVRDACLALDTEYRKSRDEAEKQQSLEQFTHLNQQIDESLSTISSNVEPYKDQEQIKQMLNKLRNLMISK